MSVPVCFIPFPTLSLAKEETEIYALCLHGLDEVKCTGVVNRVNNVLLVSVESLLPAKGAFHFFPNGKKKKKGGDFISFQGSGVRKSCESNSCCFFYSKQRPGTHWKLICQSETDVKSVSAMTICYFMQKYSNKDRHF